MTILSLKEVEIDSKESEISHKEFEINFQDAEINFQKAISLEKEKREQGLQEFDEVIKLYQKTIELNPNHAGAMNNLACLYAEIESEDPDKIEDYRATAKEYYEKALNLGQVGAKHNLRLLDMAIQSDLAEEYKFWACSHEKGVKNNRVPNPTEAIKMYEHAKATYNGLIDLLDDELARIRAIKSPTHNAKLVQYETMLVYNKQLTESRMASLENMIRRNDLYMEGLRYEKKRGHNGEPDYNNAIREYKKAAALGHVASKVIYDYLVNRNQKTKDSIECCEKAIALGHTNAMIDRARLHEESWGKRHIIQEESLGKDHILQEGQGSNRASQLDEAIELYKKAYEHGSLRAKNEIDKLAKKYFTIAQELTKKVSRERIAYAVASYEKAISELIHVIKKLSDFYKESRGPKRIVEAKNAEKLDMAIKFLQATIQGNRDNLIKSASMHKSEEENKPHTAPGQPLEKRQKTSHSSKSTLTTGDMFSTIPALANSSKRPTFGKDAVESIHPVQKERVPGNIAGNPHTTFFARSTSSQLNRPSILREAPPRKRQKTQAHISLATPQRRSSSS